MSLSSYAGIRYVVPACSPIPAPRRRLFLAFVAYFAVGAYYNYSTYGASGADLIPCVLLPRVHSRLMPFWKPAANLITCYC